jgi:hypothetical protein
MKNYIYILFLLLVFQSCDDFLDVKPKQVIVPESVEDFDLMLNDAVFTLRPSAMQAKDPYVYYPSPSSAYKWGNPSHRIGSPDYGYNTLYKSIFAANYIIENVNGAPVEGADPKLKLVVKRDAYAERAACYFILVNQYSKHYNAETASTDLAVGLVTSPDLEQDPENSTVEKMYDQILSDLWTAKSIIQDEKPYNTVRSSYAGVNGLLAKVHLYRNQTDSALYYVNKCLDEYNFVYDFNELDSNIPIELEYYFDEQNVWAKSFRSSGNYFNAGFSKDLTDLIDVDNDLRLQYYKAEQESPATPTGVYTYDTQRSPETNILVSVPDMLLIKAECLAKNGEIDDAMDILNALRVKRISKDNFTDHTNPQVPVFDEAAFNSVAILSASNQVEALELIRNERKIELAFSVNNLWDLKRYHEEGVNIPTFKRNVQGTEYTLEPGSTKYILELSQTTLEASKNLKPIF